MRILITSAASQLAKGLAAALSDEHQIRLTERIYVDGDHELAQCPLGHDFATNLLVRDLDAIVHVAEAMPAESEGQQIDHLTRGTYNLLWAAAEEGVKRVIYLSTLAVMTQYDEKFFVQEHWRPRATPEAAVLAKQLGESVCREFAREHKIEVIVLRLGPISQAETDAADDSLWLEPGDVAQAVSAALTAKVGRWSIFHIQSGSPDQSRFSIKKAQDQLGFSPATR